MGFLRPASAPVSRLAIASSESRTTRDFVGSLTCVFAWVDSFEEIAIIIACFAGAPKTISLTCYYPNSAYLVLREHIKTSFNVHSS